MLLSEKIEKNYDHIINCTFMTPAPNRITLKINPKKYYCPKVDEVDNSFEFPDETSLVASVSQTYIIHNTPMPVKQNITAFIRVSNLSCFFLTLNDMELMSKFKKGSNKKVWWLCRKGTCKTEHVWEDQICHRTQRRGCPFCSRKRVCPCKCNSLKNKFPEIAKEWNYDRNKKLPDEYLSGSNQKVWWICSVPKCGTAHIWKTKINYRTLNKLNCPFCYGKKPCPCGCNSFERKFPDIAKEWNYDRNEKSPEEYLPGSEEKVWWKCKKSDCGTAHEWQARIWSRTGKGRTGCPFCVNHKICPCECNSLKNTFPELIEEWNYNRNQKKPEEFVSKSDKKVWWKCSECRYEWRATIHNRTLGTNCPKCHSSKGEKFIAKLLTVLKVPFIVQKTFEGCRDKGLLKFDFYLTDLYACIEYDGIQHFEPIEYFSGEEGLQKRQKRDRIKNKYCKKEKIPLLRVKYDQPYI